MPGYRHARVNEEVAKVVTEAIRNAKDPRLAGQLITVTQCDVSGDLKYAKVYFSVLGAEAPEIKEIKKGLYSAAGYIRSKIASVLNMRMTPELSFEYDASVERGAHILAKLKEIEDEEKARSRKSGTEQTSDDDDGEQ